MSLNWKEINLILSELEMENASIQKIRQPDFRTLIFDLYNPKKPFSLMISLSQGGTRLHALSKAVKNQVPLQRFAQMLRSRIQGGRIISVGQIDGERIVRFEVQRAGEITILFLRLWGGAGNVIAVDSDFTILDAFYRRPKREEVSGKHFNPEELIRSTASRQSDGGREFQVRPHPSGSSFNAFIEAEYRRREQEGELSKQEERVRALIERQKNFLEEKLEKLREEYSPPEQIEQQKEIGDILMAHLYEIPPKSVEVRLPDFYHGERMVEIELDPALTAQQNAEYYYQQYRKDRRKVERLQEEIENLQESLSSFVQEADRLLAVEDPVERLGAFNKFLDAYKPVKAAESRQAVPGLRFSSGPFTILVGRTARENDTLLRRYVRGNDYWLHTRDYPGGYVFIKYIAGKTVPLETLLDAGNLALHYSKGRTAGKAELYYTQVKHLRRAKEGKQGLVLPTHEKNLSIHLDKKRLDRLLSRSE